MKREVLSREINGLKVEIEALDYLQEAEYICFIDELSDVYDEINKLEDGDSYSEALKKQRKLIVELFTVPNIKVDDEKLEDVAYFVSKIGQLEATKLVYDIRTFDLLKGDEVKK
jgi:hypothetical protein